MSASADGNMLRQNMDAAYYSSGDLRLGGKQMIFDISDREFMHIMQDPKFSLPVRWDGRAF